MYHGSAAGLISAPAWYKQSDQVDARFGWSVGTAGDVNGDGYSDIIVGAPYWDYSTSEDQGGAWVYHGSAAGVISAPAFYKRSSQAGAWFGYSVGTAGDVNGDGYSDIIVGAPSWDDGYNNQGGAWVYHGSAAGVISAPAWYQKISQAGTQFGFAVGTAGDVNGDGYSDIVVGTPYYGDEGLSNEGKVWVFHGSASGLNTSSAWSREGGQNGAYYGYSVGTAGDVNGDGYADVVIGAPLMTVGVSDEGTARVYLGSPAGLQSSYAWLGEGGQTLSWYGSSVGTAGDVNGDGYADLIVGANGYNGTYINEGQVTIYYGNASKGVSLRPRQTRFSSSTPIAPLGRSDSLNGFRIYLNMGTPFGRGRMQMEAEIKPRGVPFNGANTIWWGYWDNIVPGSNRYTSFSNLMAGTPYHWRVRIRYNPATTPFMPASRWITRPWNGWNEADFRTGGGRLSLPLILRQ